MMNIARKSFIRVAFGCHFLSDLFQPLREPNISKYIPALFFCRTFLVFLKMMLFQIMAIYGFQLDEMFQGSIHIFF